MSTQYATSSKVGVYVDTSNLYRNGGQNMRYEVLRTFACREGAELVRLNAYVSFDGRLAEEDDEYYKGVNRFYSALRDLGYKVIIKNVKWYRNADGEWYGKADSDLDLAVDMLLQSNNLDRILLVTGDGDFTRVVRALQNKGCRVEVVGLDNVSSDIRREADMFMSGYLVPHLIPANSSREAKWGEVGSTVRGVCYFHKDTYGFMRFLKDIAPNLWMTDVQRSSSPYASAYFKDSYLPRGFDPTLLPSYNHIFQFELTESTFREGTFEASNIEWVGRIPH